MLAKLFRHMTEYVARRWYRAPEDESDANKGKTRKENNIAGNKHTMRGGIKFGVPWMTSMEQPSKSSSINNHPGTTFSSLSSSHRSSAPINQYFVEVLCSLPLCIKILKNMCKLQLPDLRFEEKLVHLEQPLKPAPDLLLLRMLTHIMFWSAQQEVACLMLSSMSLDLQKTLENYNAYDMLQELKTLFEEQAKHELLEIVKAFHACKHEDHQLTIAKLHAMIKLTEKGLPKKADTLIVLAIRGGLDLPSLQRGGSLEEELSCLSG
ncbi:hypothetical protein Tco_0807335 [Tanacetum coccineum]